MSAEILREAAKVLREVAEGAIESLYGSHDWYGIGTGYREPIKAHIQAMSPPVALALADWLDVMATFVGLGQRRAGDAWPRTDRSPRRRKGGPRMTRETDLAFLENLTFMLETGESMGTAAARFGITEKSLERRVGRAKARLNGGAKQAVRRVA